MKKILNTLAERMLYFRRPKFPKYKQGYKIPSNRNPHTGENALSIEIAHYLVAETLAERIPAVWTKLSHESSSSSVSYGILMRNMGKNPGAADFIFTFENGHFWMEVKLPEDKYPKKSQLKDSQVYFKNWCEEEGCEYFIVTSVAETIDLLKHKGILKTNSSEL